MRNAKKPFVDRYYRHVSIGLRLLAYAILAGMLFCIWLIIRASWIGG